MSHSSSLASCQTQILLSAPCLDIRSEDIVLGPVVQVNHDVVLIRDEAHRCVFNKPDDGGGVKNILLTVRHSFTMVYPVKGCAGGLEQLGPVPVSPGTRIDMAGICRQTTDHTHQWKI